MKRSLGILAVLLALTLSAGAALAKDMGGKKGLGYESTLGGVRGIDFLYYLNDHMALEGVLGLEYVSVSSASPMKFMFAPGFRFNFLRAKDANVGIGVRANIGYANEDYAGKSTTHFNLEAPLILEYFLSNNFSIHTEVGLLVDFVPKDFDVLGTGNPKDSTALKLGVPSLGGGLGATFYF
jgi:hypothetical protein